MHIWKSSSTCRTVGVLLFDAFSNHCLANAVEPLRAANTLARKQLYRWQFLSLDGAVVTSSSGLPVQPDMPLGRHPGGELLFVMPSYGYANHCTPACSKALRAASVRFRTLAAMDSGSWLLAAAGLLTGRQATIHWDELDLFAERFPEVEVVKDPTVTDGEILSCGGASTAFELVLGLIEQHHGPMLRIEVASLFMASGRGARPGPDLADAPTGRADILALMRRNIEEPLSVGALADRLGIGRKTLERECQRFYGMGPRRLYRAIRLRAIRRLLEDTRLPVEEIAARGGYRNASAMARAFRAEWGLAPSDLRRAITAPAGSVQAATRRPSASK